MTDRIVLKTRLRNSTDPSATRGVVHEIQSWPLAPHNLITAFDALRLHSESFECLDGNPDAGSSWVEIGGVPLNSLSFLLFLIPRASLISIAPGMCLAAQDGRLEQFLGLDEDWEDDEQDVGLDDAA